MVDATEDEDSSKEKTRKREREREERKTFTQIEHYQSKLIDCCS